MLTMVCSTTWRILIDVPVRPLRRLVEFTVGGASHGARSLPFPRTPRVILLAPAGEEGAVQHVVAALGHLLGHEQQTL